jgi:hypothetical protein
MDYYLRELILASFEQGAALPSLPRGHSYDLCLKSAPIALSQFELPSNHLVHVILPCQSIHRLRREHVSGDYFCFICAFDSRKRNCQEAFLSKDESAVSNFFGLLMTAFQVSLISLQTL